MTDDPFANWRLALAGGKPGIHPDDPWCGYFKTRDRTKDAELPKGSKRPWVPCAIFIDWRGNMAAEIDGQPCHPNRLWPYAPQNPISYADYQAMHNKEQAA
jgi:hypothetical protein